MSNKIEAVFEYECPSYIRSSSGGPNGKPWTWHTDSTLSKYGVLLKLFITDGDHQVHLKKFLSKEYSVQKIEVKIYSDGSAIAEVEKEDVQEVEESFTFDLGRCLNLKSSKIEAVVIVTLDIGKRKRNLQFDVSKMFKRELDNPAFADVILECTGEELKCHSFVLAARDQNYKTFFA